MINKKILIVEDSEELAYLEKIYLSREGALVFIAQTGEDALRLVRSDCFDLILLDLHLGDMHGSEVAQTMRALGVKTPILCVTGVIGRNEIENTTEAHMDGKIVKPFYRENFTNEVRTMLSR